MTTFNYTCPNCDTEHECSISPGTPPKETSNPDSPHFSDPGEGPELEDYPTECQYCGKHLDEDKIYDKGVKSL